MRTKLIVLILFFFTALISADTIKFEKADASSPEAGIKIAKKMGARWMGYHIPAKRSGKDRHRYCTSHNYSGKTLHEYVYNTKPESDCYCGNAVFMRLKGSSVDKVKIVNYNRHPEFLKNSKVLWLKSVNLRNSVSYLKKLYDKNSAYEVRKPVVSAVGIHGQDIEVFNFLKKVVKSSEAVKVRKSAIFWIGCQRTEAAVDFLKTVIDSDDALKIRKDAVFAISVSKTKNLIPVLIAIAESNRETAIRKSAIFWLGQQATKKIARKLEGISEKDPNAKIRNAAVFAISQHPDGVDSLLRIAKNSKYLGVKKKAIFWLSQKDDKRALDAIKTILEQ